MTSKLPRPRSGPLTTGPSRAPARAMLRAVGLSDADMERPQVAVASSWNEVTPCNLHLSGLAAAAKDGVRQAGAVPFEFGTIAVSDGISMGTEGMKSSLVSREVIADSVEVMVHAEQFDALVAIAGCDKSLPGMLMACARLDVPAAFLYGGTILPGFSRGRPLTIQDVFEAVGSHAAGEMSDGELRDIEHAACPGAGSCAGMYTANTMSACAEALGMALPGSATAPAVSAERTELARRTGEIAVQALATGLVGEHQQARGVVAPDAAQPVGDLPAPLAIDERDHVEHARGREVAVFGVPLDQQLAQRRFDRIGRRALLAPDRVAGDAHRLAPPVLALPSLRAPIRSRASDRPRVAGRRPPPVPASRLRTAPAAPASVPTCPRSGRRSATAPRPRRYV